MILLNDQRITNVRRYDCGEKFLPLTDIHPGIFLDKTRSKIGNKSGYCFWARQSVAARLIQAAENLPEGYTLCVKEAYRPLSHQVRSFSRAQNDYRTAFPSASEEEIYSLACEFVAPPDVAGHPTGGAVDVTIMFDGKEADMGTEYNDEPLPPENKTHMDSEYISDAARENRRILAVAMEAAGFVNYPTEWWHWSYGDCYWAYFNGGATLYTQKNEQEIL